MEQKFSRRQFLHLGAVVGATASSVSLLSSCGSDTTNSEVGEGGGSTTASVSGSRTLIAREAHMSPGTATQFTDSGQPAVLIQLKNGDFVAYSAVCTHQGCIVDYDKSSGELICPCHGAVYDPAHDARVMQGPAPKPLPKIAIKVKNGKVLKA